MTKSNRPILCIQTAFLGDLLLMIPLLKRIRVLRPQSPIYLVARKGYGHLLKELMLVDEVFEIEKGKSSSYHKVKIQLLPINFELLLCPHESWTSAMFSRSINADRKISFDQLWNFFIFKERVKKDHHLPEALRQMQLLTLVDPQVRNEIEKIKKNDLKNADQLGRLLPVPDWASMSKRDFLSKLTPVFNVHSRCIAIFPGSVWETKKWTFDGFADLGIKLSENRYEVLWMGSLQEKELCEGLQKLVPNSQVLAGKFSLLQTLALLTRVRAVVSNDSAGGHLAAIAGASTVSIFGPTVLDQGFRPWNSNLLIAELFDVKCRPCGRHGHQKCPKGTHECMKRLSSQLVLQRLGALNQNND